MNVLGIALRLPSYWQATSAAVLGIGIWLAFVGLVQAGGLPLTAMDAGAVLLVTVWSCVGAQCGIRVGSGLRHLALNLATSALLLGLYQFGWTLAGA